MKGEGTDPMKGGEITKLMKKIESGMSLKAWQIAVMTRRGTTNQAHQNLKEMILGNSPKKI